MWYCVLWPLLDKIHLKKIVFVILVFLYCYFTVLSADDYSGVLDTDYAKFYRYCAINFLTFYKYVLYARELIVLQNLNPCE